MKMTHNPPQKSTWCIVQLLTMCWLMLEQLLAPLGQLSSLYILSVISCGVEYAFGWFGPAVLAMSLLSFLCTCLLAEHGKLKSHWLRLSTTLVTTQTWMCYQCYSHTESKPQHCTSYNKGNELCCSRNQDRSQSRTTSGSDNMLHPGQYFP